MNIKNILLVPLVVIMAVHGGKVAAGVNNLIELTDESGTVGGQVMIDIIWTNAGAATQTLQFDMLYDDTAFTFDSCPLNNPGNWVLPTCQVIGPGEIRLGLLDPDNLQDLTVGTLILDVNGPAGMYQVTIEPGSIVTSDGEATDTNPSDLDITDVPMPIFDLSHDGGGAGNTIDLGTDALPGAANFTVNAIVENVGNDDMNNLAGDCELTNSAAGVFTIAPSNPVPFDLAPMATENFSISCMTDVPGNYNGELTCTHNGASSPDVFALTCFEAPTPTYDSTPGTPGPLVMNGTEGNANAVTSLIVDDDMGEPMSTLTGTCGLMGDPQISISGSAAFSVPQGGMDSIDLECSAVAQGVFSSTLTCTADPSASNAGDFVYDVDCTIGPPDPGMWGSNPPSGSDINLTPVGPVPVGTDLMNAGQLEAFNAGAPGDEDIDFTCTKTGGSTEITQSPSPAMGTLVAGGPPVIINYSCDTAAPGSFAATVECVWTEPLEGIGGTEPYTVSCEVRDAYSELVESPPSGTPQTAELQAGESHVFTFLFEEIVDEGVSASVADCLLDSGTDFQITDPAGFPLVVASGETEQVQVTFTDPGEGDVFNDVLTCAIADNPPPPPVPGPEGEDRFVSWPLEITVTGRDATFRVTKDFDDDNPLGVEIFMECNTGLPLQQSATVHDPDAADLGPGDFTEINFVIGDFEPGTMDCDIFETVPVGYSVSYAAGLGDNGMAGNLFSNDEGCHYEEVTGGGFTCEILNEIDIVEVVVNKEWIDDHPEFQLPTFADITLWCNEPIFFLIAEVEQSAGDQAEGGGFFSASRFIQPGFPGVFGVFPHWDGSTFCFVTEEPEVGVLQDLSDCEHIPLAPGQGGECTVVNTRLFAGIPTLSQYGLILLALLMLGVGAIAFRRYA